MEEEDVRFRVTFSFKIDIGEDENDKFLQTTSDDYMFANAVNDLVEDGNYISDKKRGTIPKTADIKLYISSPQED